MALELLTPKWPLEQIESVYAYAYEFYCRGHYKESSELFRLLTVAEARNRKHWMGLGASLQLLKEYEPALEAYSAAAFLDEQEKDPFALIHAAECLKALDELPRALQLLSGAAKIAGKDPKYEKLLEQIELLEEAWR